LLRIIRSYCRNIDKASVVKLLQWQQRSTLWCLRSLGSGRRAPLPR
jgi:hypothetical protein